MTAPASPAVYAAALAAVTIWGASPVAAKLAVAEMSPWTVAFLRTAIGGAMAAPVALALGLPWPDTRRRLLGLGAAAFCGYIGFPVLFTIGVERTSANHASMILAALPVLTGAIALGWDRLRPGPLWLLGCAVALIGEAWLIFGDAADARGAGASIEGDLIVAASCLFASSGYVIGGRLQQRGYPAMALTFWGAAAAALALAPALLVGDLAAQGGRDVAAASTPAWAAIAFLAIGVTIIGYALWYWSLGTGGVARIGAFQFLQPISGVILAGALLGERATPSFLIAVAAILSGVVLAVRSR